MPVAHLLYERDSGDRQQPLKFPPFALPRLAECVQGRVRCFEIRRELRPARVRKRMENAQLLETLESLVLLAHS
jgi:hypothetical protein